MKKDKSLSECIEQMLSNIINKPKYKEITKLLEIKHEDWKKSNLTESEFMEISDMFANEYWTFREYMFKYKNNIMIIMNLVRLYGISTAAIFRLYKNIPLKTLQNIHLISIAIALKENDENF